MSSQIKKFKLIGNKGRGIVFALFYGYINRKKLFPVYIQFGSSSAISYKSSDFMLGFEFSFFGYFVCPMLWFEHPNEYAETMDFPAQKNWYNWLLFLFCCCLFCNIVAAVLTSLAHCLVMLIFTVFFVETIPKLNEWEKGVKYEFGKKLNNYHAITYLKFAISALILHILFHL